MPLTRIINLMSLIVVVGLTHTVLAQEQEATADEVMAKVQSAATALQEETETTLAQFLDKEGQWITDNPWVWKNTYVFVYDCKADKAIAHPTLIGKTILNIKDKKDNAVFGGDKGLCQAGQKEGGGWVAYLWPKPNETEPSQKLSFALAVEGTPYQVSAGIYSDEYVVEWFMLRKKDE